MVRDRKQGECAPVPGKTVPHFKLVRRDYRWRGTAAARARRTEASWVEDMVRPLRYAINVTLDGCCDSASRQLR